MSVADKIKNAAKQKGSKVGALKDLITFGPNGGYHDAGYHHLQSTGNIKSKAPKNGFAALNNSVEVLNNGGFDKVNKRRVGISDNEFVILNRTQKGVTRDKDIFHGYVQTWEDLRKEMQKALEKAGLTDSNGKILKQ